MQKLPTKDFQKINLRSKENNSNFSVIKAYHKSDLWLVNGQKNPRDPLQIFLSRARFTRARIIILDWDSDRAIFRSLFITMMR